MTVATSQRFEIGFDSAPVLALRVRAGACHVRIGPGQPGTWIGVGYDDVSGSIPLSVEHDHGLVTLRVGTGPADAVGLLRGAPSLELALGREHPYALSLVTGAGDNDLDLGGLPLTRVEASLGAGSTDVRFGTPNPAEMSVLQVSLGTGRLRASGLANAAFAEMIVEGGATDCRLDFSGDLRRDATVRLSTAVSSAELVFPPGTPTEVTSQSLFGGPVVHGPFTRKGSFYLNAAAEAGVRPVLRVTGAAAIGRLHVFSE